VSKRTKKSKKATDLDVKDLNIISLKQPSADFFSFAHG